MDNLYIMVGNISPESPDLVQAVQSIDTANGKYMCMIAASQLVEARAVFETANVDVETTAV